MSLRLYGFDEQSFLDLVDKFVLVFIKSILISFKIRVVQRKRGSSCATKEASSVCYCLSSRACVLDFDGSWRTLLLNRIQKLVCFGLVVYGSISIG